MFDDQYFMRMAINEALIAMEQGEIPIGCVITCNNIIIAKAHNLTQTLNDTTSHAEMQAFTAASNYLGAKYLHDCTLYVTLEPCNMCAAAAAWTQISRIVYGAADTQHKQIDKKLLLHPKTEYIGGVLAEECKNLLTQFFADKRK
ncbi:MAG: nucleoside deaminase [Bacteroidales bacterium]|nr:nucleoside deaminase [Bacteroidales bacterium]